ncbi:hypothetical protein [Thermostichus vulcanus]|uniref:Uncharacterized protein n=1 Tax=Thermostichus vulcanus str. 'Rupite' TaxID=2813851 RepID=A0ABT0C773_THEVL|nr:hypothetical protein [Thermostichus vulcanus]MCJ2541644.1 hypothetical protein [Thermostichus vulcanus str. 'Rupite']
MQDRQDIQKDSKKAASQFPSALGIDLALSLITVPILLGLVVADQARKWLGSLTWEDPGWWLGERLPNLDNTTLQARQQQRQNPAPLDLQDP